MKYRVTLESSWHKHYIELLPTVSFSWYVMPLLYVGWLYWSITIEKV